MKIYHYDAEGIYRGQSQADESPLEKGVYLIPANATKIPPPPTTLQDKYTILVWDKNEWKVKKDYRGKWWNKKTAEETEVTEINIEVSDVTFTNKPPDGRFNHQYFNDISGVWEENVIAKEAEEKEARIAEIKSKLTSLDIKKIRYLLEKEKGDLSGKKYFDEYEAETVLLRDQLKELEK